MAAHTMKAMCQMTGALALATEFEELESIGASSNLKNAGKRAKRAADRYGHLVQELGARKGG